ncbi:MAG: hypothetical protein ABI284_07285 [Nitrosospira sp.]
MFLPRMAMLFAPLAALRNDLTITCTLENLGMVIGLYLSFTTTRGVTHLT